jgi:hypothetical protein
MKLFVDDLRIAPEGWNCVRTNTDAIRTLYFGYVKEISVDHDIVKCAHRAGLDLSDETFQPVFYYLAAMPADKRPERIVIHTANPAGAYRMSALLADHGIASEIKESTQQFERDGGY